MFTNVQNAINFAYWRDDLKPYSTFTLIPTETLPYPTLS